jgi:hypothetical protein
MALMRRWADRRNRRQPVGGNGRRSGETLSLERFEQRLALAGLFAYDQTFKLDSLPTATKTIYLDFTGHRTQGTAWNTLASDSDIICSPFTLDGSPTFSKTELEYIQDVWAYVSEDFRPFNVNVSTREANGTSVLQNIISSGGSDDRWGIRCVISDSSYPGDENPAPPAQGVALLGSFKSTVDTPCFVRIDTDASPLTAVEAAMVASHEIGHTLNVDHHGISSNSGVPSPIDGKLDYYPGHTNGSLSWGPIMGAPYGQKMTQWSHGEYASASRPYQDDLFILTDPLGVSGFSYRTDAVGNTPATATALTFSGGSLTTSVQGIIEQNTDADVFQIQVSGAVDIQAKPFTLLDSISYDGANLDLGMTIYAADGTTVVAVIEPQNKIDALFTGTLPAGVYYVSVYGTGNADPLVDGYTNYGSLGTFSLSVTAASVPTPSVFSIGPIPGRSLSEGNTGTSQVNYLITLAPGTPAPTAPVTVQWRTVDGTATAADGDYVAASGTATFLAGTTTVSIPVFVNGDLRLEANEGFTIELFNPSAGAIISTGAVATTHTILNDDSVPLVNLTTAAQRVTEGHIGKTAVTVTVSLNSPATAPVTVTYATANGTATAGTDYEAKLGTVSIPVGSASGSVTVFVYGDRTVESDETFGIQLSNPVGATLGAVPLQTVTIVNDDTAQADPAITVSSPSMREGNSGSASMVFTISLSRALSTATTLWVRTANGTATTGEDYVGIPTRQVTIPAGSRQVSVTVKANGDRKIEANEVVYLEVSRNSSFATPSRGAGTIINDDGSSAGKAAFAAFAAFAAEPVSTGVTKKK